MTSRFHALTVDLEDWHSLNYRLITGNLCETSECVVINTMRILDLLDELNVRATFFVVGTVAAVYPDLVRSVALRGHEIGSHTYQHKAFCRTTLTDFRADIERSRKQLQDLSGQPVLGFRAPQFGIGSANRETFFRVLAEVGFKYDSSVFPTAVVRYGIPGASPYPYSVETPSGVIREFPLSTWSFRRYRLPVAGGTYFRFLPVFFLRRVLSEMNSSGNTGVFYFHPHEFHSHWLHLTGLTWRHRLQTTYLKYIVLHNAFTGSITKRLRFLLTEFQFKPLGEVFSNQLTTSP